MRSFGGVMGGWNIEMPLRPFALLAVLGAALAIAGCASVNDDVMDLGEAKQEFEQYSQGGNYRFQYVAEGSDGYRTILWRQGESLSDDGKDGTLVAGVVKSVFRERFCKDLGAPATLSDGSPAPLGKEGKWTASLRCIEPPPKPKPEKKKPKPKPEPVAEAKPKPDDAPASSSTSSSSSSDEKPKAAAKPSSSDGPMVCEARNGGFDCKPKR